ncbi:MAG: ornithine cyclodeaminase family protein, partial [Gammaproteobacteria bacterium]
MKVRIVSIADIRRILTYKACIGAVRGAMVEVSRRNVSLPLRHGMPLPNRKGMLGMMYGYLGKPESFGIKLVSLFPGNTAAGYSSHMGLVVLYEPEHGRPVAIMDGSVITAIRTAAASAVATDALARKDAGVMAILGTGEQAESHLYAIPEVRNVREVRVWGRTPVHVHRFIEHHGSRAPAAIKACEDVDAAVKGADIICTVTSATDPVLFGRQISNGTHVNLVGSSFPDKAEVDTEAVVRSRYFVDYRDSTLAQAGEFLKAKAEGAVDDSHIVAEIGEVLSG